MKTLRAWLLVMTLLVAPALLAAQQPDVRARLEARGLPTSLARSVASIAADASAQGVPSAPLADKAIEGWAKHVPGPRIVAAVRSFAARMGVAVQAVRSAGLQQPSGQVVAAAAEAMGRGLHAEEVQSIVRAAPSPSVAGPGLSVVAALSAQGLPNRQAVAIVVGAMKGRHAMSDVLNLPSVARAMHDQGMSANQIGRRILGEDGGHGDGSWGARSGDHNPAGAGVPPGTGHDGHDQPDEPSTSSP
jgi:hypothetical protein